MTKIIGGTILDPTSVPVSSCPVHIDLVLAQGFEVVSKASFAAAVIVQTQSNGTWQATLTENDQITPTGTLYQVTERIPANRGAPKVYLVQVLSTLSGGIHQVLDLIVPEPSPVGTVNNFVTKDYLDSLAPVGSLPGPPGPPGGTGTPGTNGSNGSVAAPNIAAVDALCITNNVPVGTTILQEDFDVTYVNVGGYGKPVSDVPTFQSTAARDANLIDAARGAGCYLQTNDILEGPLNFDSGLKWRKPWNLPWGMIQQLREPGTNIAITTAATTVLTLPTVPLIRNRNYSLSFASRAVNMTANGSHRILLNGVNTALANTTLRLDHYISCIAAVLSSANITAPFTVTADANYTFVITTQTSTGTGVWYVDMGTFIRVDDTGPSGAPPT